MQRSSAYPGPLRTTQQLSPPSLMKRRIRFEAARTFYLTLLIFTVFSTWSLLTTGDNGRSVDTASLFTKRQAPDSSNGLSQHAPTRLVRRDEACRLVHTAQDQCAFVRNNCPDEEAGLLSYLQLYYCKLPQAKPVAFIIMVVWLGLLFSTIGIAASDFFCIDLSTISSILGMSESMAGVTFLAFGNGSPDVFSTFAAMKTHSGSLAVGELIGAAGFITAVVAGSMALVRPFKVARKSFVRDVGFFIIAASFSMVFLADGHLYLWECAAMVGFYVFYVIIVVLWHWQLKRRARRRLLEEAARSHFHVPGGVDEAEVEPYHDEDEEETRGTNAMSSRTISVEDLNNLERAGGSPSLRPLDEQVDADDETRDRYLAEISKNMRVSRPKRGERRSTMNPIRPSLVGALEFRAVLSSLQKSRNIQPSPINLRRYSDDPGMMLSQAQQLSRSASNVDLAHRQVDSGLLTPGGSEVSAKQPQPSRSRAKSTNDMASSGQDIDPLQRPPVPQLDLPDASSSANSREATTIPDRGRPSNQDPRRVPNLSLSPPRNDFGYFSSSPVAISPEAHTHPNELLAPPGHQTTTASTSQPHQPDRDHLSAPENFVTKNAGKPAVPRLDIPSSNTSSQRSSPISPFPAYHDDPEFVPTTSRTNSLRLPPPSISPESGFHHRMYDEVSEKPLRWWPYKVLPPPRVLAATLFPTVYSWHDKNLWEKMLGVVAAPSVFLLTITLPVVEVDKEDDDQDALDMVSPDHGISTPYDLDDHGKPRTLVSLPPDSPVVVAGEHTEGQGAGGVQQSKRGARSPAISISAPADQPDTLPPQTNVSKKAEDRAPLYQIDSATTAPSGDWNRWLVIVQVFTAPILIVLIVHLNTNPGNPRALLLPVLLTLIGSLTVSAVLLLLTTPDRAPKFRYLLCFVGFAVSVAWISTIAGEVVGVLKALGIILNISDAILGLTIFAVGNSLGDLVADITVARLGYPVMALSACFGGPMLNILLGIGLSGLYMTIRGGERRHERHPDKPIKYKPYQIEVGGTLIISGIALLVTLLGVLIVVPLRGWKMDRRVGIGLITLWLLSTLGNVIVEIVGVGKEK